jgi:hypothetical protein
LIQLLRRRDINHEFQNTGDWWADVSPPPDEGSAPPGDADQSLLIERLLAHLNENRHYYNRLLWLTEDPNRRASWLEHYHFEHAGRSGRLIDFVENRVVDVVGDYIVLPMGTNDLVQTLVTPWPEAVRRVVSVPTRGAFAEAKLSNCNACEEIDDSRFWDWQESPCPGEAPSITGVQPGSRARDVSELAPSAPPEASVGVEGAPSAPDPTGMANILELLGRSDIFRDMSGRAELAGVMQAVVNGAVQLQMERLRQQAAAQQSQSQGAGGGATGGGATPSSQTSSGGTSGGASMPATNPVRARERSYRQAQNAVAREVQSGTITPEEGNQYRQELLEGQVRDTIDDPTGLGALTKQGGSGGSGGSTGPRLERITTAVPWPRGLAFVGDRLIVLGRGRPRGAGGPVRNDMAGYLFEVSPLISEPSTARVGASVRGNATILARPSSPPFRLWDPSLGLSDTQTDRPYAGLVYDEASQSYFVACFSGIDVPGGTFRKNSTDAIHRYHAPTTTWHQVEAHNQGDTYPHRGQREGTPLLGWLNGPDGLAVQGNWLYAVAKDNHTLARYDLTEIRRAPAAAGPPVGFMLYRQTGDPETAFFDSPSAVAIRDGFLYVAMRAQFANAIWRFDFDEATGALRSPEWVARFPDGSDLIDIAFNSQGELFASTETTMSVWSVGIPTRNGFTASGVPYARLPALITNIAFDHQDRLYVCCNENVNDPLTPGIAGVVYRVNN